MSNTPGVIKHDDGEEGGLDDAFKEPSRGDASICFVKMENGKVAGMDIYVVPRDIFDQLPEWETKDAWRTLCEGYRCIPVDTFIVEDED